MKDIKIGDIVKLKFNGLISEEGNNLITDQLYEDIKKILEEEDVENTPSERYTNIINNSKLPIEKQLELSEILVSKKLKFIYDNPEKYTLEKMYEKIIADGELDMFND